jgi:hypothetical protein
LNLGAVKNNAPVYLNTRKLLWSTNNPFFFRGTAGEGIGGPHAGMDMIWPMSITMRALTSTNNAEIKASIQMLQQPRAIPDSCTSRFLKTILKSSPANGLHGLIHCLVNCCGMFIKRFRSCLRDAELLSR